MFFASGDKKSPWARNKNSIPKDFSLHRHLPQITSDVNSITSDPFQITSDVIRKKEALLQHLDSLFTSGIFVRRGYQFVTFPVDIDDFNSRIVFQQFT